MFIGVLTTCTRHLHPAEMRTIHTPTGYPTRQECLQALWITFLDEWVGDVAAFVRYTLQHTRIFNVFEDVEDFNDFNDFNDFEDVEDVFNISQSANGRKDIIDRLKSIDMTVEQEWENVLYYYFSDEYTYQYTLIHV